MDLKLTGVSLMVLLYRFGAAGAFFVALSVASYAVASAPTRVASRLGLRGLKRQRALANNDAWATIEPLVRWLGVRVSGIPTEEQRAALDKQLSLAGDYLGLTPEEYLALFIVSAIGGGIAGLAAGAFFEMTALLGIVGAVIGAIAPYMIVSGEAQERIKNISRGLPYVIDLMALAMSAGLDFPGAVRQVVDKSSNPEDPIVEEFTLILQTLNLGRTRKDALLIFAERAPTVTVSEFVNALVQAEERGNPVADVLLIQAGTSRSRRSIRAEELAAKAGVKMTGPLALILFAVLALVLGPAMMGMTNNL
ncbi:MAG: Type secretion system protein TadC, associated with Flp pilus assembly [Labilithrix sp.]|jgi:tight adherence protein C|nr:Type secretion system protein TadC, associated with Flp pilus assembly [Labilithrix sp.]